MCNFHILLYKNAKEFLLLSLSLEIQIVRNKRILNADNC